MRFIYVLAISNQQKCANDDDQNNLLNKPEDDIASTFMGRFGGFMSANAEVEVYDPNSLNITSKFQENARSLSYVDPMRLIDLMYIISNLS